MANDLYAVADFVADALDVARTETSNVLNMSPLVSVLPITDTADGSSTHKYNTYTGEPAVGFRAVNAGRDYDHSVDTVVSATCTILDFSWRVDKALADTWRDGPEALISREGMRHLGAALFQAEKQVIYGVGNDTAGFAGLVDNASLDALADTMVVGGGGTTASTQTSVFAIRVGNDDAKLVSPALSINLGETIVTEANDANYPVYYTPASLYIGYQYGGAYSAGRIANLHASDSGANCTDDKISDLLSKFPAGKGPTHLVMNRQSLQQLQASRTATTTSGAPAPFPNEAFGVPIIVTDAILNTEAVEV